jgi:hypothetical protein
MAVGRAEGSSSRPQLMTSEALEDPVLPLRKRPVDLVFIAFFLLNLGFITYIVDVEQLVIDDPAKFTYPRWPPARLVDLVHWWGHNFDPVLIARPAWWKATIWIDALLFGPFYAVALYAFVKGREWIRLPSVMWASVMLTNVTIILSEETWGTHATPKLDRPDVEGATVLSALGIAIVDAATFWRSRRLAEVFPDLHRCSLPRLPQVLCRPRSSARTRPRTSRSSWERWSPLSRCSRHLQL